MGVSFRCHLTFRLDDWIGNVENTNCLELTMIVSGQNIFTKNFASGFTPVIFLLGMPLK